MSILSNLPAKGTVIRLKKIDPKATLQLDKLAIHEQTKISFINFDDILFCKADSNYTKIFLKDGSIQTACKCLKEITQKIKSEYFMRVHASYLVNLRCISEIQKQEWLLTILKHRIPVSRVNRAALIEILS